MNQNSALWKDEGAGSVQRKWFDGWDFNKVAKLVSPELSGHHAKHVAQQLGWEMVSNRKPTLEERVAKLEHELEVLMGDFYK